MSNRLSRKQRRIIAIANQKGGVGKTTTAINLGAALAKTGCRVLLVDVDPQGNASTGLGISRTDRAVTMYDVLVGDVGPEDAIRASSVDGLDVIPATTDLSSADIELMSAEKRTYQLHDALRSPALDPIGYDYVLIDCPPSLNLLTINALVSADSVLVPLQSEFFALEGLSQLMLTVREVRETANADLRIEGIVLTMYDGRNNLSKQVEQDARDTLGDLVFETVIPRNVRLSEAPSFAISALDYDSSSRGSIAYCSLADEILRKNNVDLKETA